MFVVAPAASDDPAQSTPVLVFLHGKGEASPHPHELPKVLLHGSPPFRALTGQLRGVTVVAPQAPRDPEDGWSWREYVGPLGAVLKSTYAGRPILAAGFSRGGLGVLQLMHAHPDLVERWALVDPQRADSAGEQAAITPGEAERARGWLRFGKELERNLPFAKHLAAVLPPANANFVNLKHTELAQEAFQGNPLKGALDIYTFLGLSLLPQP
jgi:pimeloyl-ACP methyl ester carboxylesterase